MARKGETVCASLLENAVPRRRWSGGGCERLRGCDGILLTMADDCLAPTCDLCAHLAMPASNSLPSRHDCISPRKRRLADAVLRTHHHHCAPWSPVGLRRYALLLSRGTPVFNRPLRVCRARWAGGAPGSLTESQSPSAYVRPHRFSDSKNRQCVLFWLTEVVAAGSVARCRLDPTMREAPLPACLSALQGWP